MKNHDKNGSKSREIIAIDGPAGSGKSTTARLVANKLGFTYLDTGALYRAVTYVAISREIDLFEEDALNYLIANTQFKLTTSGDSTQVFADEHDITRDIRSIEVTNNVSVVSKYGKVRTTMVGLQRQIADSGNFVVEGRDIGTVVFPDAKLKIFLIASLKARTQRRKLELEQNGVDIPFAKLYEEIALRDKLDSERDVAPLMKANDAVELDTTVLTIDEQVDQIVSLYRQTTSETANRSKSKR